MKNLKLIITTDVHGFILATDFTSRESVSGYGLSRVNSAIKSIRNDKDSEVILIDNGDAFQGSPLLTYAQKKKYRNPMAQVFNTLKYDYINLGNHDFNYGPIDLEHYIAESHASLLTSNVLKNGSPLGKTIIKEIDGKKFALIGILTHYIPNWEKPEHILNFSFKDAYTALKEEVSRIKDTVDMVIAFYHGGFEKDLITGEETERLTGENQGYEMTSIPGLDILVTGHQHRSICSELNGVVVTQCAAKAQEFVELTIDLNTLNINATLHQTKDYPIDEEIESLFDGLNQETQNWLDEDLGVIKNGDLLIHDALDARIHKHPLVSFINQVMLDYVQADFSSNALFNEPIGFKQHISMRDLVNTYIYPNTLVVKKMTGQAILDYLEFSAEYFDIINGQITSAKKFNEPKPQHYNYEMIDPLDYTIHVSNPIGSRIEIRDPSFDLNKEYTLIMSNYRANGGGNFMSAKNSETVYESSEDILEILTCYIEKNSPLDIKHRENIIITY